MRREGLSMITSPAFGKPSSRQWPLDSTSPRSVEAAPASLTTDPEQLDRATVPAKVVVVAAEAAGGAPTSTVAVQCGGQGAKQASRHLEVPSGSLTSESTRATGDACHHRTEGMRSITKRHIG